jgi:hypothetical protein
MMSLKPKHTYDSVARELAAALTNGSLLLNKASPPANAPIGNSGSIQKRRTGLRSGLTAAWRSIRGTTSGQNR